MSAKQAEAGSINFLAALDACNLVVLQMAFWMLGTGIILGAVWADESWGRPWAWDPKETFALVTWIVYLVTVHMRYATPNKAWWTAVLATIGFFCDAVQLDRRQLFPAGAAQLRLIIRVPARGVGRRRATETSGGYAGG